MLGGIVFCSAFLLFTLELMVGKAALPRFGGTAAVWTTCLFFFQFALLAGYGYAHAIATRLSLRAQRLVHASAIGIAVLALVLQTWLWGRPILPPPSESLHVDVLSVLTFLAVSAGAPFLLLTTTAPLLQAWFSRAGRGAPWRFYALSNAGSLLALLVYPFLLEPLVGLRLQMLAWSIAFAVFSVVLLAGSVRMTRAAADFTKAEPDGGNEPPRRSTWKERGTWVGLSAVGSLFLTTTNNVMCQDVAPTPMLWALPLALYLLSFIIVFEGGKLFRPRLFMLLWPVALAAVTVNSLLMPNVPLLQLVLGFSLLQFVANVLSHGALYRARPEPRLLSSFYLWMAAGGALGSLVVSGLAPLIFNDYWEFPICVVTVAVGVGQVVLRFVPRRGFAIAGAVGIVALSVAASWAALTVVPLQRLSLRNFFGVLRVQETPPDERLHAFALRHGDVTHGVQLTSAELIDQTTAYYTPNSGMGLAVKKLRERRSHLDVAVLGLGIGVIAAALGPGDRVDFYDIDENVIALARGRGGFFHYLERAKATVTVKQGDARQLLQAELADGPRKRDLLIVDVFSGDAVPTHLFTTEAFQLFWKHLADDGVLALHVSNRHLSLDEVAMGISKALGLHAVIVFSSGEELAADATWVLVAKDPSLLDGLDGGEPDRIVPALPHTVVWTDDFQSIVPVLRLE